MAVRLHSPPGSGSPPLERFGTKPRPANTTIEHDAFTAAVNPRPPFVSVRRTVSRPTVAPPGAPLYSTADASSLSRSASRPVMSGGERPTSRGRVQTPSHISSRLGPRAVTPAAEYGYAPAGHLGPSLAPESLLSVGMGAGMDARCGLEAASTCTGGGLPPGTGLPGSAFGLVGNAYSRAGNPTFDVGCGRRAQTPLAALSTAPGAAPGAVPPGAAPGMATRRVSPTPSRQPSRQPSRPPSRHRAPSPTMGTSNAPGLSQSHSQSHVLSGGPTAPSIPTRPGTAPVLIMTQGGAAPPDAKLAAAARRSSASVKTSSTKR